MNNIYGYDNNGSNEPYIGMPICLNGCINIGDSASDDACGSMSDCINDMPLAMAYVPMQKWNSVYDIGEGFFAGTIFPCLNLPFMGGGSK